jgi:diguanylate cyclase (GGDEF)-like protein
LVLIAAAAALAVTGAGGGQAFWLCLPAVVPAVAVARTRLGAAMGGSAVVAAGAIASAVWYPGRPLPAPLLALVVTAASVIALLAWRERLERERDALRDVALSDPLTGIANRTLLLARADYEVARHRRAKRSFTVLMLDLDGFKLLNDRFGHPTGDDLLRDVAAAIRHAVRDQDTVARLGGDEFCVLAPETDDRGTRRLAARAADAVQRAATGVDTLGASAGASQFPDDGTTAQAVLDAADQRLLDAKRQRTHQRRRAA